MNIFLFILILIWFTFGISGWIWNKYVLYLDSSEVSLSPHDILIFPILLFLGFFGLLFSVMWNEDFRPRSNRIAFKNLKNSFSNTYSNTYSKCKVTLYRKENE